MLGLVAYLLTLCVAAEAKAIPRPPPKLPEPAKIHGKIFDPSAIPGIPSFFYENVRNQEGTTLRSVTTYRDRSGQPLVEETTTYENGKLVRYTYDQKQVKETGEIELKNGEVHFAFRTPTKEARDKESIEPNMIVPDMVPAVVQENWGELMKGETVKTRFLVLERQESFGFKFFKDKEREINGVPVVDFILKPSSFLIAAVAPKIRITAEKAPPHRTVEMDGILPIRVPEKIPPVKRSDYRALDGLLQFELRKN